MNKLSQPQNYRAMQALGLLAMATALVWLLHPTPTTGQAGSGIEQRVAALEKLLANVRLVEAEMNGVAGPHLVLEGCNLHVRNGSRSTDEINGVGNLIVGYNEIVLEDEVRTGSHNLVVGAGHTYSNYGGFVAGEINSVTGAAASVSAGRLNAASGAHASVSGGRLNEASGDHASVSGGGRNLASGDFASVSGGGDDINVNVGNVASGDFASISGGQANRASNVGASVSGGFANEASGNTASVSGGQFNVASGLQASVSGGFLNDASGLFSAVSGGSSNDASHEESTASGGIDNNTAFDGDHVP